MFLCCLGARRQVALLLVNSVAAATFMAMFEVDSILHGDSMNNVLCRLDVASVQEVVTKMVERLIRKKVLDSSRLLDRYFLIAIDGTGTLTYGERHCPHCLTKTHKSGKTTYYHPVLEAKLVTPCGFAFSLLTEFIENPGKKPTKQDCERKAFYRLAERLKKRFPRLSIVLLLDGLYPCGPVFAICKRFNWKYMIVLKDGELTSVNEEFEGLWKLQTENKLVFRTGEKGEVRQVFRWVNDILYVDSEENEHTVSVLECIETKPDEKKNLKTRKFKWVTNLELKETNVIQLANYGGRQRWKIENQGFNIQKNGGYKLEHAYTNDETGMKVYYFLLQIAHMTAQLVSRGSLLKKAFPRRFGSLKNLAFRILEAWRNSFLLKEDIDKLHRARIQIRFDTS